MTRVRVDNRASVTRASEPSKKTGNIGYYLNEKATPHVMSVFHFHLLIRPQKLYGKNKRERVLTFEASWVFVSFLNHLKITHKVTIIRVLRVEDFKQE